MTNYYLLQANGPDRSGIVSSVSQILYKNRCNLEDSSMMRLGSEFGILLIFTSKTQLPTIQLHHLFSTVEKKFKLDIRVRKIPRSLAKFRPLSKNSFVVTLYGFDKPGLVFHATSALSRFKFNITNLTTHRTARGGKPGYILFIEGELPPGRNISSLKAVLNRLQKKLRVKISTQPVPSYAI